MSIYRRGYRRVHSFYSFALTLCTCLFLIQLVIEPGAMTLFFKPREGVRFVEKKGARNLKKKEKEKKEKEKTRFQTHGSRW